jgi:ABC-type dipeptide/oligopeptide/nickel transport system permease component
VAQYVIRRLLQGLIVIIGVTMIAYGVLFLTGDPTYLLLDVRGMTDEQIAAFRSRMGFDRPWIIQYVDYMNRAVRGDLGRSFYHNLPNVKLIAEHLPATMELGLAALFLNLAVAVPVGIVAAMKRGRRVDGLIMLIALIGQAMPVFWLGLLLMLIFAVHLGWLPVSGRGGIAHLVLPAITLASFPMAQNARMVRSSMLEVLGQDFVRTARAKGLTEWVVVVRHALKNALIPVVTLVGIQAGFLLGGAVITETIFAWPGMGRLIVQAIYTKDIPLVQSAVIMLALVFVSVNLAVDLFYAYLDPRIRFS